MPEGLKPRTYQEIAEELNRQGMTTMTGKEFTEANVMMMLRRAR